MAVYLALGAGVVIGAVGSYVFGNKSEARMMPLATTPADGNVVAVTATIFFGLLVVTAGDVITTLVKVH